MEDKRKNGERKEYRWKETGVRGGRKEERKGMIKRAKEEEKEMICKI